MASKRSALLLSLLTFLITTGAQAGPVGYTVGGNPNSPVGFFGTIDLGTGLFHQIGPSNPGFVGVATIGNTVFGDTSAGDLYRIDPATGNVSLIGNSGGPTFSTFAGTPGGALYGIDPTNSLYAIDPNTGSASLRGSTGLPNLANANFSNALAASANAIYYILAINSPTDELYTLNPTTGLATDIGPTGVQAGPLQGMGGAGFVAGQLFGLDFTPAGSDIYTIDTMTGAATFVASTHSFSLFTGSSGLVPEPASIVLTSIGLVAALTVSFVRSFPKGG
jgi:hypothetical protein